MTFDNYTPSTALTTYYSSRTSRAPARHWATEKHVHDSAGIGQMSFFEGPGPNPMSLPGASTAKLWLDCDAGVTETSGTLKYYKGSGSSSDEANWLALTPAAYLAHLGGLSPVTSAEDFATKAAVQAASISSAVTYLRIAGYTTAGDLGGALYKKVGAEPAHAGKIQSADGAWWEIAEQVLTPYMYGAAPDGSTQTTALQAWLDTVRLWPVSTGAAPELYLPPGVWVTGRLQYPEFMTLRGAGRKTRFAGTSLKLANGTNDHLLVPYNWANGATVTMGPVTIDGITFDGNKTNQSSDCDILVVCCFKGTFSNNTFLLAKRHGVFMSTRNEANTATATGVADNTWSNNRYEDCGGAGWYGDDTSDILADQLFYNEVYAGCGSETYAAFHTTRSAGFVQLQPRLYDNNARFDMAFYKAGRTQVIGGHIDHSAIGVTTATVFSAGIYMESVGSGGPAFQSGIQICDNQITMPTAFVDNGVTSYNGVYVTGDVNALEISGNVFMAFVPPAVGRAVNCVGGTAYGSFNSSLSPDHLWPSPPSISRLTNRGGLVTQTVNQSIEFSNFGTLVPFGSAFVRNVNALNASSTQKTYISESVGPAALTAGAEDGFWRISGLISGVLSNFLRMRKGSLTIGGTADGNVFSGDGYCNANRYYYGGAAFSAFGTGSPESVVTAPVGSTFHRTDGGAGTSFYVKESGTGNTGWVAK